jgi:hypothetical protein
MTVDDTRSSAVFRRGLLAASLASLLALVLFVAQPSQHDRDRGGQLAEKTALSVQASAHSLAHHHVMSLYRFDRDAKFVDPRTRLMLLQCSDSVAMGSWGSREKDEVDRFQGVVGERYTVECPTRCLGAVTGVYGCGLGPYMDISSICKAAIAAGLTAEKEVGMVTFVLGEPKREYVGCPMYGKKYVNYPPAYIKDKPRKNMLYVSGTSYTFPWWDKADDPEKIARKCSSQWLEDHPVKMDGSREACPEVVEMYRMTECNQDGCRGNNHSFTFLPNSPVPIIKPHGKKAVAPLKVEISPGDDDATTRIICLHGRIDKKSDYSVRVGIQDSKCGVGTHA